MIDQHFFHSCDDCSKIALTEQFNITKVGWSLWFLLVISWWDEVHYSSFSSRRGKSVVEWSWRSEILLSFHVSCSFAHCIFIHLQKLNLRKLFRLLTQEVSACLIHFMPTHPFRAYAKNICVKKLGQQVSRKKFPHEYAKSIAHSSNLHFFIFNFAFKLSPAFRRSISWKRFRFHFSERRRKKTELDCQMAAWRNSPTFRRFLRNE